MVINLDVLIHSSVMFVWNKMFSFKIQLEAALKFRRTTLFWFSFCGSIILTVCVCILLQKYINVVPKSCSFWEGVKKIHTASVVYWAPSSPLYMWLSLWDLRFSHQVSRLQFWNVTLYVLIDGANVLKEAAVSIFRVPTKIIPI